MVVKSADDIMQEFSSRNGDDSNGDNGKDDIEKSPMKVRLKILATLVENGGEVHDRDGYAATRLAKLSGRSVGSIRNMVRSMEAEGLIERVMNVRGRRTYKVTITPVGRAFHENPSLLPPKSLGKYNGTEDFSRFVNGVEPTAKSSTKSTASDAEEVLELLFPDGVPARLMRKASEWLRLTEELLSEV